MSIFTATRGMFSKGDTNSDATELKEFPLGESNPGKQARKTRQSSEEFKIEKLEPVTETKDDTEVEKTAEVAEVEAEIVAEPEPVSAQLQGDAFAEPEDAAKNGLTGAANGEKPVKDGKNVKRFFKDPKFKGPKEEDEDDEEQKRVPVMACQFDILFELTKDGIMSLVDYPRLMSELAYAKLDYHLIPHDVYVLDYKTAKHVRATEVGMPRQLADALIQVFWSTIIDCKIYAQEHKIKESSLFSADSEDKADDSSTTDAEVKETAEPEAKPESDRKEDAKADGKSASKKGKKKRPHGNGNGAKPRNSETSPNPEPKPKSDSEAEASSQPTTGNDAENPAQTEPAASSETSPNPESQAAPEPVPEGADTSVAVPVDDPAFKASSIGGSTANTIQVKVSDAATAKWDDRDILDGCKDVTPESGQVVDPAAAQAEQQPATASEPTQTSPAHDTGVEVYDEGDPQGGVVYNDFSGQIPNKHALIAPKPLQPVSANPATPQPSPEPASSVAAPMEQQPTELTDEAFEAKLKAMLAEALPGLMKQSQPTGAMMPNRIPDGQPTGTPAFSPSATGAAPTSPIPANQPTGVAASSRPAFAGGPEQNITQGTIQDGRPIPGVTPQEYTQDSQPAPSVDYQGFIPGGQPAPSAAPQWLIQGGQPAPSAAPIGHATGNGRPATSVAAAPQFVPGSPAAARRLGCAFHP